MTEKIANRHVGRHPTHNRRADMYSKAHQKPWFVTENDIQCFANRAQALAFGMEFNSVFNMTVE